MARAATANPPEMARLFLALPRYADYVRPQAAAEGEQLFRLCLGQLLQDMAAKLSATLDLEDRALLPAQQAALDTATEDLGALIAHLNRRGAIRLVAPQHVTAARLADLDSRLLMLIEHAWWSVRGMVRVDTTPEEFDRHRQLLEAVLDAFAELAEERNQQLGLGWESEFGMSPLDGRRKE